MVFQPGQSGNPKGRRPKPKRKFILVVTPGGGDIDECDFLSCLVSHPDADLHMRMTAAGMLARLRPRKVSQPVDLPVVETIEQATACIAEIARRAAAGTLGLDEARDLIDYQRAFIEAKIGTDTEQRIAAIEEVLEKANLAFGISVSGGMPELPVGPGEPTTIMPAKLLPLERQPVELPPGHGKDDGG
jgi:hypothetical protein